ncbi:unnamed protein product [Brugia timori]|uniref:Transcriptional regulator n=1 Tax=Brugia timori TaxID=42155 RepID=A0A0R3QYV3_9BILA|nr:unnamed protein product [Brugia timori]
MPTANLAPSLFGQTFLMHMGHSNFLIAGLETRSQQLTKSEISHHVVVDLLLSFVI